MNFLQKVLNKFSLMSNQYINLIHNHETNHLEINCKIPMTLSINGNFCIKTKDGDLNFISENGKLCLDSINSKIYLNSREGNEFKFEEINNVERCCKIE